MTLETIQSHLGGKIWEKGDTRRLYVNYGQNTKKISTKTYIEQIDGVFVVKCFIECDSQPWAWVNSQKDEIIANVSSKIKAIENGTYGQDEE